MAPETKPAEANVPASIIADIVREMKKPYIDPDVQARKERDRQRLRHEEELATAERKERQSNCPHVRQDNTSVIAWMTNSDNVTRGVCQRCNKLFTPEDPDYIKFIRIPTRAAGIVF
jgi:transposase-like protein